MIELKPDNGWIAFDSNGVRFPWYSSGVLEILDKMDLKGKRIFEYGGGNSTIWFKSRGAIVEGVDSNPEWAAMSGLELQTELIPYTRAIYKGHKFDLICIDGIFRDDCTEHALNCIEKGGMIIIDNWMQPSAELSDWHLAVDLLAVRGLPHTVYREAKHCDWGSLIIQC
jgi:hypothetical protein